MGLFLAPSPALPGLFTGALSHPSSSGQNHRCPLQPPGVHYGESAPWNVSPSSPLPLLLPGSQRVCFITALRRQSTCHTVPLRKVWLLVYSRSCVTITTVNFRTFSSLQKENPYPLAVTPHVCLFPSRTIYLLFLWICLFWTFHVSGVR